jgi:hypothetical protein
MKLSLLLLTPSMSLPTASLSGYLGGEQYADTGDYPWRQQRSWDTSSCKPVLLAVQPSSCSAGGYSCDASCTAYVLAAC